MGCRSSTPKSTLLVSKSLFMATKRVRRMEREGREKDWDSEIDGVGADDGGNGEGDKRFACAGDAYAP